MSGNTFGASFYSDCKKIAPMLPEFPEIVKCKKCKTIYWLNKNNKKKEYWPYTEKARKAIEEADEALFLTLNEYIEAINLKIYTDKEEEQFLRIRLWWAFNDRIRPEIYEMDINDLPDDDQLASAIWGEGISLFSTNALRKIYEFNRDKLVEILDKKGGQDEDISDADDNRIIYESNCKKTLDILNEREKERQKKNIFETDGEKIIYEKNCTELLGLLGDNEIWETFMRAEINRNLGNFAESNTILDTISDEECRPLKILLKKECEKKNRDVIKLLSSRQ